MSEKNHIVGQAALKLKAATVTLLIFLDRKIVYDSMHIFINNVKYS